MKLLRRITVLSLALLLAASGASAAKKKESKPVARAITTEVVQEVPETIQQMLDLAYSEWQATDGQDLKEKNKFTKWRNNYPYGWCGGFITWLMLEVDIPQQVKSKTPKEEVPGLVHVKEAGVGKLYDGYARMNRITRVPQKGFIAVFGTSQKFKKSGATPYYHVGLVYDVEKLSNGKYRLTTIEGNVTSPGDETHSKVGHTVRMYVRDYTIPLTDDKKEKESDLTLVPESERTEQESALFSYHYTYENEYEYITICLMPWIPEESAEE